MVASPTTRIGGNVCLRLEACKGPIGKRKKG